MSRIELEFTVPADHPSLPGHFPGNPIVPGVLLIDQVLDGLRRATGRGASHLKQVKLVGAMRPGETALAVCEVEDGRVSFRVTTVRGGAPVPLANGTVSLRAAPGGAP